MALGVELAERADFFERAIHRDVRNRRGDELLQTAVRVFEQVAHDRKRRRDRGWHQVELDAIDERACGHFQLEITAAESAHHHAFRYGRGLHRYVAPVRA